MNKKNIMMLSVLLCVAFAVFGEPTEVDTAGADTTIVTNPWSFSTETALGYSVVSDAVASTSTHFAPITSAFSGITPTFVIGAAYTIPVPFSSNPLFANNTVQFVGKAMITPISIHPFVGVMFTPIAVLQLGAYAQLGLDWPFAGVQSLGIYNKTTDKYDSVPVFSEMYYNFGAQATFMFDIAALFPGDWTHIITTNTYQINYIGTTADCGDDAWMFEGSGEHFNVLGWYANFLLGYQTPALSVLNLAGVSLDMCGVYNDDTINDDYDNWNPLFTSISISPVVVINLIKDDTLTTAFAFSSRRSFTTTNAASDGTNFGLTSADSAREWFFSGVSLTWTHKF